MLLPEHQVTWLGTSLNPEISWEITYEIPNSNEDLRLNN